MAGSILEWGGLLILLLLTFAETGLFLGLILPGGETLIFTAGLLAGTSTLNYSAPFLIPLLLLAALLGDFTAYFFGKKYGSRIYHQKQKWFRRRKYLKKAENFYHHHKKTGILAGKFVPFIRPFTPLICGIIEVNMKKFSFYTFFACAIYINAFFFLGYFLTAVFPGIRQYIGYIIPGIIVLAIIPFIISIVKEWRKDRKGP